MADTENIITPALTSSLKVAKNLKKYLCWLHPSQDILGIGSSVIFNCKGRSVDKERGMGRVDFMYRAAITYIRASGEVVKSPLWRDFPRKRPECDCSNASQIPGRRGGIISSAT